VIDCCGVKLRACSRSQLLITVLGGWLYREQADVIAFLRDENRLLKTGSPGSACVSTMASADA
jgi:hypothetical protein